MKYVDVYIYCRRNAKGMAEKRKIYNSPYVMCSAPSIKMRSHDRRVGSSCVTQSVTFNNHKLTTFNSNYGTPRSFKLVKFNSSNYGE